jgi:hypothetical protein
MRREIRRVTAMTTLIGGLLSASGSAQATTIADVFHVSDFGISLQQADSFELTSGATTITGIQWSGIYVLNLVPAEDDFTIRIFEDDGGLPSIDAIYELNVGEISGVDTGINDSIGHDVYEFSVAIAPISLTAGTTYWLSIVNDTCVSGVFGCWGWFASDSGSQASRSSDDTYWSESAQVDLAFRLTSAMSAMGAVPEPGAAQVFGIGCVIVGAATRRACRR